MSDLICDLYCESGANLQCGWKNLNYVMLWIASIRLNKLWIPLLCFRSDGNSCKIALHSIFSFFQVSITIIFYMPTLPLSQLLAH